MPTFSDFHNQMLLPKENISHNLDLLCYNLYKDAL